MSSPLILCLLVLLFGTCLASPIVKRDADADCDNSLGTDYYDPLLCPPTSSSSSTTEEPTTETTTAESGEEDVKMVRKREVEEEPEVSTDQSTSSTTESVEMRSSADKCIRATQDVSGCCTVFTDSEAQQQQCIRDHTGVENRSDSSSDEAEEEDSKVPSN